MQETEIRNKRVRREGFEFACELAFRFKFQFAHSGLGIEASQNPTQHGASPPTKNPIDAQRGYYEPKDTTTCSVGQLCLGCFGAIQDQDYLLTAGVCDSAEGS